MIGHILTLRAAWWQGVLKAEKIEKKICVLGGPNVAILKKELDNQLKWNREIDDLIRLEIDRFPSLINKLRLKIRENAVEN